jgi:hypothetical protein
MRSDLTGSRFSFVICARDGRDRALQYAHIFYGVGACPTRGGFDPVRASAGRETMVGTLGQFGDRRLEKGGRCFLSV